MLNAKAYEKRVKARRNEVKELQTMYLILKAANETIEDQFKESAEAVLAVNEFYAEKEKTGNWGKRCGGTFDGRVRTDVETFMLSDLDFDKYLQLLAAECHKRGLTDAEGKYVEEILNTKVKLKKLKNTIAKFAVELLPEDLAEEKEILLGAVTPGAGFRINTYEDVIDLFMKLSV